MAVRDDPDDLLSPTQLSGSRTFSRYDLVLAAVPAAFTFALVAGHVLSVSLQFALVAGSLLAALVVGDALFRAPPVEQ